MEAVVHLTKLETLLGLSFNQQQFLVVLVPGYKVARMFLQLSHQVVQKLIFLPLSFTPVRVLESVNEVRLEHLSD